jgi:predicted nucleic acid-binding protein
MIEELIQKHSRLAIDSNVLIYLLEGTSDLAERAGQLIDAFDTGRAEGVLSTLALTEVCTGPARFDDLALVERYADEITSIANVRIVGLDAEIAVDAAILRGNGPLSVADAVHLATARDAGATVFVTNDRGIKPVARLEVAYLDEL